METKKRLLSGAFFHVVDPGGIHRDQRAKTENIKKC